MARADTSSGDVLERGSLPRTGLLYERLVQRALLTTSDVLARVIDEGDALSARGVHSVRVSIKRLRASWRLLAAVQPEAAADAEARLRSLHHALAFDRFRTVRAHTLERLARDAGSAALDEAIAAFSARQGPLPVPATPLSEADGTAVRTLNESVGRTFRAESKAWRELPPVADDALWEAIRRSYRRVRRATDGLHRRRLSRYHRLRLRLKQLLYQLEACGLDVALGETPRTQWWWLADRLGRLQDVDDLRAAVTTAGIPAPHAAVLHACIAQAERRLLRKIDGRLDTMFPLRARRFVRALACDPIGAEA